MITYHMTYSSVKTSESRWIEDPFEALQLCDTAYYPDNVVCLSTSLMTMTIMVAYCTSTDMPVIEQSIQAKLKSRVKYKQTDGSLYTWCSNRSDTMPMSDHVIENRHINRSIQCHLESSIQLYSYQSWNVRIRQPNDASSNEFDLLRTKVPSTTSQSMLTATDG